MTFFFADICNFGVDTTFHTCDFSLESLVKRLEHGANLAVEWFDSNYMKLKPFTIWNTDIKEQKSRKFLFRRMKSFCEHHRILFLDHSSFMLYNFFWLKKNDICNFGVDTTIHTCDFSLESLVKRLEHGANLAVEWFDSNYMKLNQNRCCYMVSGHKFEAV